MDAQTPMYKLLGKRIDDATFLLDDYPSAAAAYSLRKLRSAYAGSAIRVRRSGDGAEQDIGFSSNVLDVASLLSFCAGGSGDGFIVTWYDQSGNANNIAQSIAGNQPQIVVSGSVVTTNGKPTVDFGTNITATGLNFPTGFLNGATTISYFQIAQITDFGSSNAGVFGPSATGGVGLEILQHSVISRRTLLRINLTVRNDNSGAAYQLWDDATQSLTTILGNSTSVAAYKNSASVTLTNSSAMPALNFNGVYAIGQYAGPFYMNGNFQELVIYTSDETANRTGIETNINSFYAIY